MKDDFVSKMKDLMTSVPQLNLENSSKLLEALETGKMIEHVDMVLLMYHHTAMMAAEAGEKLTNPKWAQFFISFNDLIELKRGLVDEAVQSREAMK